MLQGWFCRHLGASVDFAAKLAVQRDGSVAVIFAIALVPLMVAVGAAVDYSRANQFKWPAPGSVDTRLS
jgi:Flp pilus assembly protein TadG